MVTAKVARAVKKVKKVYNFWHSPQPFKNPATSGNGDATMMMATAAMMSTMDCSKS